MFLCNTEHVLRNTHLSKAWVKIDVVSPYKEMGESALPMTRIGEKSKIRTFSHINLTFIVRL